MSAAMRGQPVGLVAAQVADAAQPCWADRRTPRWRRWSGSARRRRAGRCRCRAARPVRSPSARPHRSTRRAHRREQVDGRHIVDRGGRARLAGPAVLRGWTPTCTTSANSPRPSRRWRCSPTAVRLTRDRAPARPRDRPAGRARAEINAARRPGGRDRRRARHHAAPAARRAWTRTPTTGWPPRARSSGCGCRASGRRRGDHREDAARASRMWARMLAGRGRSSGVAR